MPAESRRKHLSTARAFCHFLLLFKASVFGTLREENEGHWRSWLADRGMNTCSYYGDDLGSLRNGTAQARRRMRRSLLPVPLSA